MVRFGYTQVNVDHTLFVKWEDERVTILLLYVDDMAITCYSGGHQVAEEELGKGV